MVNDPSPPTIDGSEAAWHEIDGLVDRIAGLSRSEFPPAEFYAELLGHVVSALAAVGGAVWTRSAEEPLRLASQLNLPEALATGSEAAARHRQIVEHVLATGETRIVAPHAGPIGESQVVNPTEHLLILGPWRIDDEWAGVIELFQRGDASPAARRGYVRFLGAVAELVEDYHRNRQLRTFRRRVDRWGQFEQFVERVHGSLDLKRTAYQIANEGRRLAECDRLSVAVRHGSRYRLLAVSGVDTVNRRANAIRFLERLTAAVAAADEPLWYPEGAEDLAPPIERHLQVYLDESHVRTLAVVPLGAADADDSPKRQRPLGALVAEWYHGGVDETSRATIEAIRLHGASALRNAMELHGVPLLGLLRLLGRCGWLVRPRQLPVTLLVLLGIAAGAAALALVPADFEIEARGRLQPVELHDIFAPSDGVVGELRTGHGEQVRAGQVLAVLRRPELDLQFQQVWGELQTAEKRLGAVEAERLQNRRETEEQRRRYGQLTAEEEELRLLTGSLRRQYEIVRQQQARLEVRSPADGQVLTWNLRQLLEARPVQQGQVLMSVARLEGPWVLEIEVPDDHVAYVLEAQRQLGAELDVRFVLATDPGVAYQGKIERIALRAEAADSADSAKAAVKAIVYVDRDRIAERVPGATVVAKVYCGRRAVGYVWLHDFYEAVRSRITF